MRIGMWAVVVTLWAGCQEYAIDKTDRPVADPPAEDLDTDTAAPVYPDVHVDPPSIRFLPVPPGCEAEPAVITVSNVGDAPLDITNLVMNGPDGVHFDFDPGAQAPFRVRPGVSFEMRVGFSPAAATGYDQVLILLESNDPDEAQVRVPLAGEGFDGESREDRFVQHEGNTIVDVLFVVDNSESMSDNLTDFAAGMDAFIDDFLALNLDFHLGVTTMDMSSTGHRGELLGPYITSSDADPAQSFRDQVSASVAAPGASNEVGYAASRAALTAPRTNSAPNQGFLRTSSNLAVVVISDEDEGDANPEGFLPVGRNNVTDDYVAWLQSMKADPDDVSFSGMVGPQTGGLIACGFSDTSATRAPQYNRAIRQTSGMWSDICDFDVIPFLNHLGYIARGLDTRFSLSATPDGAGCSDIEVRVDGQLIPCNDPVNGWVYDATHNEIEVSGAAIPEPGQEVVITYPVSQECL